MFEVCTSLYDDDDDDIVTSCCIVPTRWAHAMVYEHEGGEGGPEPHQGGRLALREAHHIAPAPAPEPAPSLPPPHLPPLPPPQLAAS